MEKGPAIRQLALSLAEIDVSSSLAVLAHERVSVLLCILLTVTCTWCLICKGYVRPEVSIGLEFDVQGGSHPVVDAMQTG